MDQFRLAQPVDYLSQGVDVAITLFATDGSKPASPKHYV